MGELHSRGECLRWFFGDVELDESELSLTVAGLRVVVEPRPVELLKFMLRRGGEVCTKDELMDALWPGRVVTEGSLTTCVAKLRQALSDTEQVIIRTAYGYGYRLGVPVRVETVEAPDPSSALQLEPGMAVPRRSGWSLAEKLGEGGTGEVWLGRGKTGEQRVFKFSQNAELLASLKREVTLSRLLQDSLGERADFVRVLDWNFDEPPYYLETDYCPAGNLSQWLARQTPLPPLTLRLEWVAQAAEALASAHALGVLHKDLKPSNLLVEEIGDGRIRVKLGDWGSGRVLDMERLRATRITRLGFTQTQTGSSSTEGTPVYRAPEVAAGQPATIQADLYALGVMLYQLVIGDLHKPLAPGWERDIDDELLREDIAQTADGDPAKRLSDAAELARRIRSLANRREQRAAEQAERQRLAQQQRLVEQWRARRNWVVASVLLLISGLVASLFLYRRAEANAADALKQTETAQATETFLLEIFFADDRSKASERPLQETTIKAALDNNIDRVATTLAEQPQTQLQILRAAQMIYYQWNDYQRWRKVNAQIFEVSEGLYGPGDPRTLVELLARADAEAAVGDFDAERATVVEAERRIVANGLEGTAIHANALYYRSRLSSAPENDAENAALLERTIPILRRLHLEEEGAVYIIAQNNLGAIRRNQGRLDESRTHYLEAIRVAAGMPDDIRNDAVVGAFYGNLAETELARGDIGGAEQAFSRSQELLDKTYGDTYPMGWKAQAIHAEFMHRRGDRKPAMEIFDRLMQRVETLAYKPEVAADIRLRYAGCLLAEGRAADAIPLLQAVLPVMRDVVRSEQRMSAVQTLLAEAYETSGKTEDAKAMLKVAHDKGPNGSQDLQAWAMVRLRWAQQLIRDGEPAAAQAELETLVAEAKASDSPILAMAQADLSRLALARGDTAAALDQSQQSMATLSRVQAFHDVRVKPQLWRVQAEVLARSGDAKGAAQWCTRTLEASRKYDHPQSATLRAPCPQT